MLPDIQPGNTKILYFFNCLLDGMHTIFSLLGRLSNELNNNHTFTFILQNFGFELYICPVFFRGSLRKASLRKKKKKRKRK